MTVIKVVPTQKVFDFSQATKRQLYNIATDPLNRMGDRYAAVRELQKRGRQQSD